jgi:hypothetical protein
VIAHRVEVRGVRVEISGDQRRPAAAPVRTFARSPRRRIARARRARCCMWPACRTCAPSRAARCRCRAAA